ncbi:hypothetical protein Nepgr_031018 [Nepenthes gracilis]|uniref:RRM domain-containing protein n=1 Tax=Nepenthes gracilis TaxID=150966 RepID=A0AAD3Y6D8_NEPGR|nr:hypothetical protein Nepgr_031018 [Nepenthes gracilis]
MDSDQGKLFIGGISWETSEDKLKEYFGQYGDVLQTVIMRDKVSARPRGFGFVVFADPAVVDRVLQDKHTIDGRTVEAKRALSREEQQNSSRSGTGSGVRNYGSGGNIRTKKIFVGGLPPTLTEDGFRQYFENYGSVTDVVIMYDQNTQRPRGFGFISFDGEEAVDRVLHKTFHDLNGKQVEVKRALPKDANPAMSNRSTGSGVSGGGTSAGSGGYRGYDSSSGNPNAYDGRMDANRYMQSQNTGGPFAHYGSSGHGAPGYGYGPVNNSMGYGGYGGYGGANPGYGGLAGAAYGNPNVPTAGYANGPPGATRSSWGPSGYGAVGYGNPASWGASGAGGGGSSSGPPGQSLVGASGYGNQAYLYGSYGGNDGSYGSQGGYGNLGRSAGTVQADNASGGGKSFGDTQGNSTGFMGSGYSDSNGHSGYGSGAWRSDPSQTSGNFGAPQASGPHGHVGGYGGAQTRQAQQQ